MCQQALCLDTVASPVILVRFVSTASPPTRELCFAVPVPAAVTALGDRDSFSSCMCDHHH